MNISHAWFLNYRLYGNRRFTLVDAHLWHDARCTADAHVSLCELGAGRLGRSLLALLAGRGQVLETTQASPETSDSDRTHVEATLLALPLEQLEMVTVYWQRLCRMVRDSRAILAAAIRSTTLTPVPTTPAQTATPESTVIMNNDQGTATFADEQHRQPPSACDVPGVSVGSVVIAAVLSVMGHMRSRSGEQQSLHARLLRLRSIAQQAEAELLALLRPTIAPVHALRVRLHIIRNA